MIALFIIVLVGGAFAIAVLAADSQAGPTGRSVQDSRRKRPDTDPD